MAPPSRAESVPLTAALGRVPAARTITAAVDVPPFANSAMDGFAVRAADLPGTLRLVGEVAAGVANLPTVAEGTAVRISTGAPLPPGADTRRPDRGCHRIRRRGPRVGAGQRERPRAGRWARHPSGRCGGPSRAPDAGRDRGPGLARAGRDRGPSPTADRDRVQRGRADRPRHASPTRSHLRRQCASPRGRGIRDAEASRSSSPGSRTSPRPWKPRSAPRLRTRTSSSPPVG